MWDTKLTEEALKEHMYCEVGNYCILHTMKKDILFDINGHIINLKKDKNIQSMIWDPLSEDEITEPSDIEILSRLIPEDKIEVLSSQLREKCIQKDLDCEEKVEEIYYPEIFINGNTLILRDCKEGCCGTTYNLELYSIDSCGNLQLIPKRCRKKNYR